MKFYPNIEFISWSIDSNAEQSRSKLSEVCWWLDFQTIYCQVISHPDWLDYLRGCDQWKNLQCVIKIQSNRRVKSKKQPEFRYYICSRIASATDFPAAVRSHWGVENNVHWVLDVTFDEDGSRIRKGDAQQNFATMRRIALNILNKENTRKDSLKGKRQPVFRPDVLSGNICWSEH